MAREALLTLHARFIADPAEQKGCTGQEAVILRCLIEVTVQEGVRESVNNGGNTNNTQKYSRLAQLYSLALERARLQDFVTFFGRWIPAYLTLPYTRVTFVLQRKVDM